MFLTEAFLQLLVTNGAVLLAALIGFWGVIYSQRRLSGMAEAARAHETEVSRTQAEVKRKQEYSALLNALRGELSAIDLAMESALTLLEAQIGLAEDAGQQNIARKMQPRISFQFATPVFDSHVARIGLLTPGLAFAVTSFFGRLKSLAAQPGVQIPDVEPALAARIMHTVLENLSTLRSDSVALGNDLAAADPVVPATT